MLRKFFNVFKVKKKKSLPTKKHLVLQTVYGSCVSESTSPPKPIIKKTKPIPKPTTLNKPPAFKVEESLEKQLQKLKQHHDFSHAAFEKVTLEQGTRLLGFTRQRALFGSVFLYPEAVRYASKWQELEQEALLMEASIGLFETCKDIVCLKIVNSTRGDIVFLVNKDCIRLSPLRTKLSMHDANTAINQ